MTKTHLATTTLMTAAVAALIALLPAAPAAAQQQIGFDPIAGPICAGPLGPGPCAQVHAWIAQHSGFPGAPMPGGFPGAPPPTGFPGGGPAFPGAGMLPQDAQIMISIQQGCGGEPTCMAAAWGSVEVSRCRNGFGVPGGCFGPNGEIMKVINSVLPHNLHPNVIIGNAANDIQNGPGASNDLVGKDGWVCRTLFGGC